MCLKTVLSKSELEKEHPKLQALINTGGIGYKCIPYGHSIGGLVSECQGNRKKIPINRWLNEKDYRHPNYSRRKCLHTSPTGQLYKLGFHVFLRSKDAHDWGRGVRKVKFRNVVAIGNQLYGATGFVVVAKEILVIPKKCKS